ncbi:long-chain-fatty-acid--CoA ligase [Glycocaulis alkaliphilus]|uniref:3-methylmercaptopropionyl-CoA ligase n=1 Tax=Glycocaulis alkaliphilus TaxID=1434191 RepID=A0A3T0EAI7_9PROT|nr:long-chain-fatty-acid--CoA ligase [Glycocaulis alkaliphilus]AZU04237.1 long-chain-fatty-acid--CoA ligase [Glycocaulis alkaliphilus]GGB76901.1 long-chain-fatty-acid--CoA ligase [Glycocaulis alkaliphilus]
MLRGQMMNRQLMISGILQHAADNHGGREIVSRLPDTGEIHRYGWKDCHARAKRLANVLTGPLKVKSGDRVSTIAWNTHRHLELYYAVSGVGAVIHTVNPRLSPDQIAWMLDHAKAKHVFFDVSFAPIIDAVAKKCKTVKRFVVMTDSAHAPKTATRCDAYEDLLKSASPDYDWPEFDENLAAGLCYTSGTTGDPKGALYSHRSTVLHAMACLGQDVLGVGSRGTIMPVVPMFHVNAWGVPYATAMGGGKLVMPGAQLDGKSLQELIESEQVTQVLGVPTVWLGLLQYLRESGKRIDSVENVLMGGSAMPEALLRAYQDEYGVDMQQGWGMTEMSPLGTVGKLLPKHDDLSDDEKIKIKLKQGRLIYGVEMRAVDDDGNVLPRDGKSSGHIQVRGPWIIDAYFRGAGAEAFTDDGWFRTGDVGYLDTDGYMTITDRSKDVIKSGGEWISSIDLENVAMGHPDVMMAAAVGMPHPKWQERPLLVIQPKPHTTPTAEAIQEFLAERLPKWWVPDGIEFIDEMPIGATGKILKTRLREIYKDYQFPDAG